ncbi:MAG TPA: VCBS repeat-containing protein, partial [Vicinamibacterales bacterium]|nr:VCBS repeat-containing protein [Vicinamibacterales bacterium]
MRSSLVAFLGVLIVAADLEFPASARPADSPQAVDASSRMGDPAVLTGTGQGGAFGRLVDAIDGADVASGPLPAPGFTGGVRVAVGDVNGDGVEDYIVGAGPGGGQVRVYSGVDVALLLTFAPFGDQFSDGVYVAAGDINGDGRAEIVVGAGRGGIAAVFSAADGREIGRAFPFTSAYQDGVTVAAGDIDGDGRADVLAGQTVGGLVAVLSGADGHTVASGFPYGPAFAGGVNLAAGDVNGDGRIDIITAPHAGGNLVLAFSGVDLAVIASITPYADAAGVTVAAADVDGDGRPDIITGAAAGTPLVRIFSGADQRELNRFAAFDSGSGGGVFVASTSR